MEAEKLRSLVALCREMGVTALKTADVELTLAPLPTNDTQRSQEPLNAKLDETTRAQLESLTSLIKMGDSDLLDRLFPATEATQDDIIAAAEVE